MHKITTRAKRRGSVHPAQHNLWLIIADECAQAASRREIEWATTERQCDRFDAGRSERVDARWMGSEGYALLLASALQRYYETVEEGFGTAEFGTGHELEKTRHRVSALVSPEYRPIG